MTFEELKPLVDKLSQEDLERLNDYLHTHLHLKAREMDIDTMLKAAEMIRDSMSAEDLDEMIAAMNAV